MSSTAIILEDEYMASKRLVRMITEVANDIQVIAVYESIEETARHLLEHGQPDILFLDIHVADGNSLELFNVSVLDCKVIFTTAFDKYAVEAFRKNATDYLLKPLKKDELIEAIVKATPIHQDLTKSFTKEYKNRILVKFGKKLQSIKTSDIAYIYSKNKISFLYTNGGKRIASDYKLQELETMVDPNFFIRANRQFIVHIDAIDQILRHEGSRLKLSLIPSIDEEIVISTEKTKIFKDWIKR